MNGMKKYAPLAVLLVGVLVVGGVFLKMRNKTAAPAPIVEEETVAEIPFADRPVASLTPTSDGHWLNLVISNITTSASSMDYELVYRIADGREQGVPGNIKLKGETMIERKLLLGSESSGKFRYDEGVSEGTLTLKFRNEKGKLVGKLTTPFHLQTGTTTLSTVDGAFTYTLTKAVKGEYFVTMETFGIPDGAEATGTPYGVFSSTTKATPGTLSLSGAVKGYIGEKWVDITDGSASSIGIFVQ